MTTDPRPEDPAKTAPVIYDDSDLDGEPAPKPQCQIGDETCESCQ